MRGTAVVGTLAVLLALAAGDPAGPGGSGGADRAQRHTTPATASPTTTATGAPTSTPAATGAPASSAAISFTEPVDPTPFALREFYAQRADWRPCKDDDDFDCATVRVPVDYTKPTGDAVRISLRRLAATGKAQGSLFINPGGPGGSGIEFVGEDDFFGDDIRERWHIVGFDPRGIGESGGFDCLTDRDLDAVHGSDPTPRTAAERRALDKAAAARLDACLRRGGELAAHMGTEDVARDLDILRAAVGDERLGYYGISYGTVIGAAYADLFTSRVGLMVLDSAVTPDGLDVPEITQADVDDNARHWAREFDALFKDFVDACNEDGPCPLGKNAKAAGATVIRLLDRLDRRPLPTEFDSLPQLTEGWAVTAISEGLLDEDSWPYLVEALDYAITEEEGSDLAWFAMVTVDREEDGTYPGASYGKHHLPVTCADWPVTTWEQKAPSPSVARDHPLFDRVNPPTRPECLGWKGPVRVVPLVGAELVTPVLVIGNEGDPVTPIEDTEYLSHALIRSRFVSVDASGHGAYANGNSCADEVVEDYLARAIAPRLGFECEAE